MIPVINLTMIIINKSLAVPDTAEFLEHYLLQNVYTMLVGFNDNWISLSTDDRHYQVKFIDNATGAPVAPKHTNYKHHAFTYNALSLKQFHENSKTSQTKKELIDFWHKQICDMVSDGIRVDSPIMFPGFLSARIIEPIIDMGMQNCEILLNGPCGEILLQLDIKIEAYTEDYPKLVIEY